MVGNLKSQEPPRTDEPHNSIIKYNADTEIAQKYVTLSGGQELEEEFFVHDIDRIPKCAGHSE